MRIKQKIPLLTMFAIVILQSFCLLGYKDLEGYFSNFYNYLLFFGIWALLAGSPNQKLYSMWSALLLVLNALTISIFLNKRGISVIQTISIAISWSFIPLLTIVLIGIVFYSQSGLRISVKAPCEIAKAKSLWIFFTIVIAIFVMNMFDLLMLFDSQSRFNSFYHPYIIFLIWILFLVSSKVITFLARSTFFLIVNIVGFIAYPSMHKVEIRSLFHVVLFLNIIPLVAIIIGTLFYPRKLKGIT